MTTAPHTISAAPSNISPAVATRRCSVQPYTPYLAAPCALDVHGIAFSLGGGAARSSSSSSSFAPAQRRSCFAQASASRKRRPQWAQRARAAHREQDERCCRLHHFSR